MIKNLQRFHKSIFWILLASIVAAGFLTGCGEETPEVIPPRLVNAMAIGDTSELMKRTFPGRARAAKEANMSFRVTGPLIKFPVKVGDQVKEGDIVARLDPQDYETSLRTLEGQLDEAVANRKRAEQDLKRVKSIQTRDPGAVSQVMIDKAVQVRNSSSAGERSLQASVQNARDQLSYTYLKAPFDGVVVETYVENFETVRPRQPILRVLDPSSIEFVINVPENLITLAPYVEDIKVAFDALPDVEVSASISEIGREASQATRTYPVTLLMAQPEGTEIIPGMAGEAKIISRPPAERELAGIHIPATAIFAGKDQSKSFVWVISEGTDTLSPREVILGQLTQYGMLIKSGLKAGERIVTKGVNSLQEGQQVRIVGAEAQEKAQ